MATSSITVCFSCPVDRVWRTVTDLAHTEWRSDLARVEVLDKIHFVEYTRSGYVTNFTVTSCEEHQLWSFTMENENMSGFWKGIFEEMGDITRLTCDETITAKHWWMRPLVPGYLRRQQRRYLDDLRRELQKISRCNFKGKESEL